MKKLRITVDGKVFDVSVELLDQVSSTTAAPVPAAASAPAASAPVAAPAPAPAPAPAAAGAGDIPSPLAGKVVSLDVAPGTAVKAGDQIMTLEAMKMNTTRCRKGSPWPKSVNSGRNRPEPPAVPEPDSDYNLL